MADANPARSVPLEATKPPLPLAIWLGLAVLLALTWLAFAVWYWLIESPAGTLDDSDLALRFGLAPLGIIAATFALRGWLGWRRTVRAGRAARAAEDAERAAAEARAAAAARAAEIRHRHAVVFGFAVATKFGDAPAAVLEALSAQMSAVDAEVSLAVRGDDRVLAARIAELEPSGDWPDQLPDSVGALDGERRLHRVAILADRALAALGQAVDLPPRQPISIRLALPAGEFGIAPELFQPLFTAILRNHRWADWPIQFELPAAERGLFAEIDAYIDRLAGEPNLPLALYVAADSWIDPELVERLADSGRLANAKHPGFVPGEAAAALLIGPPHLAIPGAFEAQAILRRPALQTGAPRGRTRRGADPGTLIAAVNAAIESAGAAPEQIAAVSCDGDARAGRNVEVAQMMTSCTPALQAIEDQLATAIALGHCGAAGPLLALAIAAGFTAREQSPALAVSVSDDALSAAVVMMPAQPAERAAG